MKRQSSAHQSQRQSGARDRSGSRSSSHERYQTPVLHEVVDHERKGRHQPLGLLDILARFP